MYRISVDTCYQEGLKMNYKKTYSFRLIILITLITAFFAAIIAAKSSVNTARADTDENRFTVNQINKITYFIYIIVNNIEV